MSAAAIYPVSACPFLLKERVYRQDKSPPPSFASWKEEQGEVFSSMIEEIPGTKRWGYLVRDPGLRFAREKYVICLDESSPFAGNLYRDDPEKVLMEKFLISAIFRPPHMVLKTLYHLSMIGVAREIFVGVKERKPAKDIAFASLCSCLDIVRTPVYETAMTVLAIAAVILYPIRKEFLYDIRALTGRLSYELHWGKRIGRPSELTPCMWRVANVMALKDKEGKVSFEGGLDRLFL